MRSIWQFFLSLGARGLSHPRLPWALAALALALCSPALRLGWILDDHLHRASLLAPPALEVMKRTPFDLFHFIREPWTFPSSLVPWWTSPELRIAFFRPLTGLTHAFDFALWPDRPFWVHLHSLLWMAAIVVAAALLYRRLAAAPWVAGLAGLLFALDDAHTVGASWIADRYTLVAGLFALGAILAYDRWRRDGWRTGAWLAPLLLALGLLGGESALGAFAYLASHALFLDPGTPRARLRALVPCLLVGAAWVLAYKLLGCGASHSAEYIDPGSSPLAFLRAASWRAPLLLGAQVGFPPSDLFNAAAGPLVWVLGCWAGASLALFGLLAWPLLRMEPAARFWGLGMVLSALPLCAGMPSDRLLLLPGLGGMALVALLLARGFSPGAHGLARTGGVLLLLIHLGLAPLVGRQVLTTLKEAQLLGDRLVETFPADEALRRQTALVLHAPSIYFAGLPEVMHAMEGRPIPAQSLALATGVYPLSVERPDACTLVIRPDGGFLLRPRTGPAGRPTEALRILRSWQAIDWCFRGADEPFPTRPFERQGIRIEILGLTPDGRPEAVAFRFPAPLEDPRWRWIQWQRRGFAPFPLPALGQRVRLVTHLE